MPNENKKKGDVLEKAVRLIQQAILKSDPKFAGVEFTIENNKIEIVSGVRHEIDILVKTLPGSQYESIWIFECKNWNKPTGKNEVIVLTEKVRILGAARGFLVAREFTADAEAQAKLDNRLNLIHCTDDFFSPLSFALLHIVHDPDPILVNLKQRGVPPLENPNLLDWRKISCRLKGEPVDFRRYVFLSVDEAVKADKKENHAKYNHASSHYVDRSLLIKFEPGEFTADGMDIEYMRVDLKFWVSVHEQKLVSKFELKNQGRVFSFEPIKHAGSGKEIQIDIVQRI